MRIIFGLGSNLGDREFYLDAAIKALCEELFLKNLKTSKILANPAMLLDNSPIEWNCEFLNIAFSADIDLEKFPPQKILEVIKKIEKKFGRDDSKKWAPREIDIDILAIDDLRIRSKDLTVPHPGLFGRDFFIKTATEIESDLIAKLN